MGHSYAGNFVHLVFSTKDRVALIDNPDHLWAYMSGITDNHHIPLLAIGGMPDHAHVLFSLPATITLADAVNKIKTNSSRWMSERGVKFEWQTGYGAFSVSPSQLGTVKDYIRNQAEHHKKRNFEEEFIALLKKSGIAYDPRFVFG